MVGAFEDTIHPISNHIDPNRQNTKESDISSKVKLGLRHKKSLGRPQVSK